MGVEDFTLANGVQVALPRISHYGVGMLGWEAWVWKAVELVKLGVFGLYRVHTFYGKWNRCHGRFMCVSGMANSMLICDTCVAILTYTSIFQPCCRLTLSTLEYEIPIQGSQYGLGHYSVPLTPEPQFPKWTRQAGLSHL